MNQESISNKNQDPIPDKENNNLKIPMIQSQKKKKKQKWIQPPLSSIILTWTPPTPMTNKLFAYRDLETTTLSHHHVSSFILVEPLASPSNHHHLPATFIHSHNSKLILTAPIWPAEPSWALMVIDLARDLRDYSFFIWVFLEDWDCCSWNALSFLVIVMVTSRGKGRGTASVEGGTGWGWGKGQEGCNPLSKLESEKERRFNF